MKHHQLLDECRALGLQVRQEPAEGRRSYSATGYGVRVYWSTSYEGSLLYAPRVIKNGVDTHALSLKEVRYLVNR